MPTKRIAMRRIREILKQLRDAGLSTREVARRTGLSATAIRVVRQRFDASGIGWPLAPELTDTVLEERLYGASAGKRQHSQRRRTHEEPDWAVVNRELKRKHVTLQALWDEYNEIHPNGYRYSRFCELYRDWEERLPVTMRQTHLGGERLFVDYGGDTVPVVIDRLTGKVRPAHIFVAVMGASSLSFAFASWTETLVDWVDAHERAFAFYGGMARLLVPDNAKVAVIKACLYDPQVNRSYGEMAAHYGTAVLPARPYRPRDKAKVEACVGIVQRWLLGRLRNRVFYGLAELNEAIADLMRRLNDERVLRQYGRTRRQLFEELDAPLLAPLPTEPFVLAEWYTRRVGIDYHVEVAKHYYSAPYSFARAQVEVRQTARTVEIFAKGERIAAHMRSSGNGRHTTIAEHMPSSHQVHAGRSVERAIADAEKIGPSVKLLCEMIVRDRAHPEQAIRACKGIAGLVRHYGAPRVDAAALRALEIGGRTYRSVRSILENKLDGQPVQPPRSNEGLGIEHPNIRGSRYYN